MERVESKSNFEDIIEANKARIYRICGVYAVAPVEPADLFQEVIYHIWKSMDTYKGAAELSTWIYRIAINVCMRYQLKLNKHNQKTMRLSAIKIMPEITEKDEGQKEKILALRSCIQKLKEGDRSIVILYLEGLAYNEISEIIGMSENYIAVKMKRIRKTLFDCMSSKLT